MSTTPEEEVKLKAQVKRWLLAGGWGIEDMPHEPHVIWAIQGSFAVPSMMMGFYQVQREPDCLILQIDAPLSQSQATKFDKMRKAREPLIMDLHTLLYQHHIEFTFEESAYKVTLIERIYLDGLTQDSFWRRLRVIRLVCLDTLRFFALRLGYDVPARSPEIN